MGDDEVMCGRYASTRTDGELARELDVARTVGESLDPSWNVAPTQPARVVVDHAPHDDPDSAPERQLRTMKWGLLPSWAKDKKIGRMINARAETVTEKPAYRRAAAYRRCLVPADGYYEWMPAESGPKVPHYLHRGNQVLTFAGVYELKRPGFRAPFVLCDRPVGRG